MGFTLSFDGGFETYSDESVPETEADVRAVVKRFIEERFDSGEMIADEVSGDDDKWLVFWSDSNEITPSSHRDDVGELVAFGAFSYRARKHSTQTIWSNHFVVRDTPDGVFVYVSGWYGPTVDSWSKKVSRDTLYLP